MSHSLAAQAHTSLAKIAIVRVARTIAIGGGVVTIVTGTSSPATEGTKIGTATRGVSFQVAR